MQRILSSMFAGLTICFLLLAGTASAGQAIAPAGEQDAVSIPRLVNYQGFLTDAGGTALNGSYDMGFRILDAATGGTSYWSETQAGVAVSEGVFNVILGSVSSIESLPAGPNCYLEIAVGGELITPRVRLVSVPYSYGADMAADAEALGGVGPSGYAPASHPHSAADITSGTLAIARGGTNNTTYTQGGALYYSGSAVASTGAGTSGQVLTSNGSSAPTWQTPASGSQWTDAGSYIYANNNTTARVYDYNAGSGIYLYADNTTNSSARPYGVYGIGSNGNGTFDKGGFGVYGYGHGYYGQCYGLYGYADVTTANASYPSHGVYGYTPSSYGRGVTGVAAGTYSYGVYGAAAGMSYAVYGVNSGAYGALGSNTPSAGVYGYTITAGVYPVYGYNGTTVFSAYGVYGRNDYYGIHGALGSADGPSSVYGLGGSYYAGYFRNSSSTRPAVYGYNSYENVRGELGAYVDAAHNYSCGVYGYGYLTGYGVYGYNASSSYGVVGAGGYGGARFFDIDDSSYALVACVSSKIYGSGSVSTFIIDEDNKERALACPEAPEVVFEDYGSNRLVNGFRRVNLDPLLLRGVTINDEFPMRVYVTVKGTEPVPVSVQNGDGYFEVYGPEGSNVAFDWRIVANRKDYTNFRFPKRERPDEYKDIGDHPGFNSLEPDQRRSEYTQ